MNETGDPGHGRPTRKVLAHVNNLSIRGTELNAVDFAVALRDHGYETVIVSPSDTIPDHGPTLIDVAREREVAVVPFERPTSLAAWTRELDRLAADTRPDLVHVYGPHIGRAAYLGPCRFGRTPLVLTDYEMQIADDTLDAPTLIVGAGYLLDDVIRRGRTVLVSPPVDLDRDRPEIVDTALFRARHGLGDGADLVVLVTRLDSAMKENGVRNAILAMTRVENRDATLVIAGTGDREHSLRALAADVETRRGQIVFTGSLRDPRPAYASATVSLGMGGSAARALAFGNPLVVLGESGWSEIFTPATATTLFRNSFWSQATLTDPVGILASQIDALLGDPERRLDLIEFGRGFATKNFGLTAMAAVVADCYRSAESEYGLGAWLVDLPHEVRAGVSRLRRSGVSYFLPERHTARVSRERVRGG